MKLNLGCGTDYRDGWCNVDKGNCRCDIIHDIESLPWFQIKPLQDSSVDQILMRHVFEHIEKENFIPMMREMYRVCKPGATIAIAVPYALSDNFFTDPTHKMPFTSRTFDFFDSSRFLHENGIIYGWDDIKIDIYKSELIDNPPYGPDLDFVLGVVK